VTPDEKDAARDIYVRHGIITAAEADLDRATADRQRRDAELRAHDVLGQIMQRVPANIRIGSWAVNYTAVDIMLSAVASDHDARAKVMQLAEQFDFGYSEAEHNNGRNIVAATGAYKRVPVKFWHLVKPCNCGECGAVR